MHLIRESFTNHFLEPVPLMPFYLYYALDGVETVILQAAIMILEPKGVIGVAESMTFVQ